MPKVTKAGLPMSSDAALFEAIEAGTQTAIEAVNGMNSSILAVVNEGAEASYAASYTYVYYAALALSIVAVGAAVCLRDMDQYLTSHVSRQIYHKDETKEDVLRSSTESLDKVSSTKEEPSTESSA